MDKEHTPEHIQESLLAYSKTFDALVSLASEYALAQCSLSSSSTQDERLQHKESLLSYSKEYLLRDLTAATLLTSMGSLFKDLGDYANAKQKFEEAIDYTPASIEYTDPIELIQSLPVPTSSEIMDEIQ